MSAEGQDNLTQELERLRVAMAGLEAQLPVLGESIVQPALDSLAEKIIRLESQIAQASAPQAEPALDEATPDEIAVVETEAGVRRIVTILFADIVSSTALAEGMDPEEYHAFISQVLSLASNQIEEQQGTIVQYQGDGMLALFGAHAAGESDPERALRAALAIHASLKPLQDQRQFQMRIGVHTGLALVGEIGGKQKKEFTALGDAVNVAARIQSHAPPGGVLATHDTLRFVRQLFEVLPQPPLMVKGKSQPIQTYVVLRALPGRFQTVTRGVAGIEYPTIGRQDELALLRGIFQKTIQYGEIAWVQLTGEAGIGKSRLVQELLTELTSQPEALNLIMSRQYPGDENQAYSLVRRLWFDQFRIAEDTPLAEAERRWLAGFRFLTNAGVATRAGGFDDWTEAAYALGILSGLPFAASSSPTPHPNPAEARGRAIVISRQLLTALRSIAPVVILLEDLHWLDAASWDYLAQVLPLEKAHGAPEETGLPLHGLFILATARPEWHPPQALLDNTIFSELHVNPLSQQDSAALTQALLGQVQDVPVAAMQQLNGRAEGVPYYLEEMVNLFIDRGIIDTTSLPWRFRAEKYQESPLPDTLQHLLQTRLEGLKKDEQNILQYGAVLGRSFWEGWLDQIGYTHARAILQSLEPRNFVRMQREASLEGQVEWSFFHSLQSEVAYASLLIRIRRRLHKQAARWLETQARLCSRLDEFAGRIAEHLERAGADEEAVEWYDRAGRHAYQRGALQAAFRFFEQALTFLPADQKERRFEIMLQYDETLRDLGETPKRLACDQALVALAQELDRLDLLAEALYRQASYLGYIGNFNQALEIGRRCLPIASLAGNLRALCLVNAEIALIYTRQGNLEEAEGYVHTALPLARQCDDQTLAIALTNLSLYYSARGDYVVAAQMGNEHIAICRRMNYRKGLAIGLGNRGYDYLILGMYTLGIVTLEEAREISSSIGMQLDYTDLNLGLGYWRMGEFHKSQEYISNAIALLTHTQDAFGTAAGQVYLALTHESRADYHAASEQYQAAVTTFDQIGAKGNAMDGRAGLARCHLAMGDLATALVHAEMVWKCLQSTCGQGLEFPLLAFQVCYRVYNAVGRMEEAQHILEQGKSILLNNANRIGDPEWRRVYLENIPEHRWFMTV